MKTHLASIALLLSPVMLSAQDATAIPPPTAQNPASAAHLTAEQLEQLVAPIALYPDALIALILPASTAPTDIVLAARTLRDSPGDRAQIEHRAWDDSVKSLTNYPDVLKWMDENLQWTQQLGDAFAQQPADVMEAIQRLRAKARAAGTLVDTPQQVVIAEPQVIRIVPAQPVVIYVPYYEPDIVFVDRPIYYGRPYLTFGFGVAVGSWLAFDCDWHRHTIWVGNRHRHWRDHDWRQPVVPIGPAFTSTHAPETRQWRPPPQPPRPAVAFSERYRAGVVRPVPMGVRAPTAPSSFRAPAPVVVNAHDSVPTASAPAVAAPSNPPAQSISRGFRRDYPGPRPAPDVTTTTPSAPVATAPAPNPLPTVPPLPTARRSGIDTSRDSDTRVRPSRNVQASSAPAPQVVPSLPMNQAPQGPAATVTPNPQRSYSYSRPSSTPAAAPIVAPAAAPVTPATNRSVHIPAAAISAPPPAVINAAPAPAPTTAPQAAPASNNSGGDARGQGQRNNSVSRGSNRDDAAR